jgi:hypothetical protein
MFKGLTLKNNYVLAAAAALLFFLCYQFAFKKTLAAWQTHQELKNQIAQSTDLSVQPDYLYRKNNNLKRILELYQADTIGFRNNSISNIAVIAEKENVKLSEVPMQDPLLHTDEFIIQKLAFEGDFFSPTKTLNVLQITPGLGIVKSVIYQIVKDKTGFASDKKLNMEVYLEIVK